MLTTRPETLGAHLAGRRHSPDDFVFTSPEGGALRHNLFYRRIFKPAVVAAGLPGELRFHDLRHTCPATSSPSAPRRWRTRSKACSREPGPRADTSADSRAP